VQTKTKLSQKDLWKVLTTTEDYPKWCKYCKLSTPTDIKEGAIFHDVTTLLWVPIRTKHIITKVKHHEELHFFSPLQGGGKLWNKNYFTDKGNHRLMTTEISFDLGNPFYNYTIGYLLKKRWLKLLKQGFPGLEEVKHLQ